MIVKGSILNKIVQSTIPPINTYKSIFISDFHLGTKDSKADLLVNFLKNNSCETLYLVGDIIDGWKIQQNRWNWKQSHSNVIRNILSHSKRGTKVIYIPGNHDEFLRPWISKHLIEFGNISVLSQTEHTGINGKRYLVTHGDLFDGLDAVGPWLGFLGDRAYDVVLWINNYFNFVRHKLGFGYWSLSKYLKHQVKEALNFMLKFEDNLTNYAAKRGFDGVICGHIHTPAIKIINGIEYMNDGDFVESCSALVEEYDGSWKIVFWTEIK